MHTSSSHLAKTRPFAAANITAHRTTPSCRNRTDLQIVCLSGPRLHLGRGTLLLLLAGDATTGLALCGVGGGFGLLGLLLGLGGCLLVLALLDGLLAGGGTGLGPHGAALLDHVERGTDDGALVLDRAAGALLGDFLFSVH